MLRWLSSLLWRLRHPGQAACRRCGHWKRVNSHYGFCYQKAVPMNQHASCGKFIRKCV